MWCGVVRCGAVWCGVSRCGVCDTGCEAGNDDYTW